MRNEYEARPYTMNGFRPIATEKRASNQSNIFFGAKKKKNVLGKLLAFLHVFINEKRTKLFD